MNIIPFKWLLSEPGSGIKGTVDINDLPQLSVKALQEPARVSGPLLCSLCSPFPLSISSFCFAFSRVTGWRYLGHRSKLCPYTAVANVFRNSRKIRNKPISSCQLGTCNSSVLFVCHPEIKGLRDIFILSYNMTFFVCLGFVRILTLVNC